MTEAYAKKYDMTFEITNLLGEANNFELTSDIEYVILLTSRAQDLFCIRRNITMFSGSRVRTLLSDGSIYDVKNHLMVKNTHKLRP